MTGASTTSLSPPSSDDLRVLEEDPMLLEEYDSPAHVVPRLPAQAFVNVARKLREQGRLDLILPHASPDQLTALMDLDVWRRDRVDLPRARQWLLAIADAHMGPDRERGDLTETIDQMDPEMWTFALVAGTLVHEIDPERDDSRDLALEQMGHFQTYETPDGTFVIGAPNDELGRAALRVIDRVYSDSLTTGRRLVLSVVSAVPSIIEEDLLRWRTGRLADLGFVEWEEAMKLFRPLDRDAALQRAPSDFRFLEQQTDASVPVVWRGHELLRRVMERLGPREHGIRSREFLLLVNEVGSAQRFDPGDEPQQQRAIDQTSATLGLGLEMLAAGKPNHPDPDALLAERVEALGLRELFRVGYGALHKLRQAALELHRQGRASLAAMGSLLDRPWGESMASLGRWYPELPKASGRGTRPLRGLADVNEATTLLAQAAALVQLAFAPQGYGIDPTWITRCDEPERVVVGDLVRTAVIHAQLPGSRSNMAPLTPEDVRWAAGNLLEDGRLVKTIRQDFAARCRDLGIEAHADALADNLLTRLAVELSALEFDEENVPRLEKTGGLVTIQRVSMWLKTTHGVD